MSFITKKHLSRRTFLRGTGVSLALPLLDSMIPAGTLLAQTAAAPKTRLGCIYIPHGATMDKWTPAGEGTAFQFSEILQPLEAFRDRLVVVSDLAHAPVAPATGEDTGGAENHVRAAAVFLSGAHPVKKNEAHVGVTVDQLAAQHVGQDTPLPSIELSMEPVNLTCGDAGFTCAYRNTLSWKNASLPLPMENNPQIVFQRLFGDGSTDAQRQERRNQAKSLLDSIRGQVPSLEKDLPAGDRQRLRDYLDEVREIERRVKQVDATLSRKLDLPDAPVGIPADFEAHLKLMFDLQVLAYKSEVTRISTLMFARENSNAVYAGHRRARRLPQRVAPLERAEEHGPVRRHQPLPREDARLLPGAAAGDARRRRHPARPLDDSLRQQPERRQRAQLRSAAGGARRRRLRPADRRTPPAPRAAHADVEPAAGHAPQAGRAGGSHRRQHRAVVLVEGGLPL